MAKSAPEMTVFGAGIFGLSIAWEAVSRGASVQVIDPNGAGSGASGGLVGALAPHMPEAWSPKKQFQFEALDMAQGFWDAVTDAGGIASSFGRIGRLQPIEGARALELAQTRAQGAARHWQGRYGWQIIAQGQIAPWLPSPSGYLIHDSLSARIAPQSAIAALVAGLRAKGVTIAPKGAPRGVIVEATGAAGLAEISRDLGRFFGGGEKGQAALLDCDLGDMPQVYAQSLHLVPHRLNDGRGVVAVGSTTERHFDDPSQTDAQLDALIARARALCPPLTDAPVLARWAGLRPRTKSRAPILGRHPLRRERFIANGGFKIGFGIAPRVAQAMVDLVLEGRDTIPADFAPETCL